MESKSISALISQLRARVGELSARAIRGEDLITGAISDANENINVAVIHYRNGDYSDARESLQLASEQLDTAEQ